MALILPVPIGDRRADPIEVLVNHLQRSMIDLKMNRTCAPEVLVVSL
jgi:hypothetical protein